MVSQLQQAIQVPVVQQHQNQPQRDKHHQLLIITAENIIPNKLYNTRVHSYLCNDRSCNQGMYTLIFAINITNTFSFNVNVL